MKDVQNIFVNEVCRPSSMTFFRIMALADKIKPKDAKNKDEYWDTCDFYRHPAIIFKNGSIRARKDTDKEKFGCRKPTSQEGELLKGNPEELDKFGFEIIIQNDNSS
jgi:hypothetical protein